MNSTDRVFATRPGGHSLGGSTLTRVANTAPDLLAQIVYLSTYCCVASSTVPSYARPSQRPTAPLRGHDVQVQDRMIAEADHLTPANPFTVHTIAASHFAPTTQPSEIADILTSGVGKNRGAGGHAVAL